MKKPRHPENKPDVIKLIHTLAKYKVRYVIVGSVAAGLYGIETRPRDLDITPALDQENLQKLVNVLNEIEASLPATDEVGQWEMQHDGEKKWVSRKATPQELDARLNWQPDPGDSNSFDHLFQTRFGNFDVVPDVSGGYDTLTKRAYKMVTHGQEVLIMHIDELLAALTVPRRKKDVERVRKLRTIQRSLGEGQGFR